MNKIIWLLKQLFPLLYYSVYKENNDRIIEVWKMWFGKCYNIRRFKIEKELK